MAALLMGLSTLVGFEASANIAEEAKDPHRSVPRAIVGSVIAAAVLGTLLIIALTVAIRDMGRVSRSASPVAEIMSEQFGPGLERPFMLVIGIAFFGAGLVTMAGASRIIFAMARDGRLPAHNVLKKVNPRTRTPIPATLLVVVVGVVVMIVLPGGALLQLIQAGAIINLNFSRDLFGWDVVRAGRRVGLIVPDGHGRSAGVARGRAFHGRWGPRVGWRVSCCSGEGGPKSLPSFGYRGGPAPGGVDA
jgi:amino acid transporter